MAATFLTSEWTDNIWGALRSSDEFRHAASAWVHGPLMIVVEGAPTHDEPVGIWIQIHEGEVRDMRLREEPLPYSHTPFILAAGFERWKSVFSGQTEILPSVTQGLIRASGDLSTLSRHETIWNILAATAARIETTFPEEVAAPVNA